MLLLVIIRWNSWNHTTMCVTILAVENQITDPSSNSIKPSRSPLFSLTWFKEYQQSNYIFNICGISTAFRLYFNLLLYQSKGWPILLYIIIQVTIDWKLSYPGVTHSHKMTRLPVSRKIQFFQYHISWRDHCWRFCFTISTCI